MMSKFSDRYSINSFMGVRMRYLIVIDLFCCWMAIVMSFAIRYESLIASGPYLQYGIPLFIIAPLIQLPIYYLFRLYYRIWRYASSKEMLAILSAGAASTLLVYLVNFYVLPGLGLAWVNSRSVVLLTGVLSTFFLAMTRFILRLLQERYRPQDLARLRAFVRNPVRVLIIGAGDAGAMILREIRGNPGLGFHVVGFIDDNPDKRGFSVYGIPVLGNRNDIAAVVAKHSVDEVIIAMPATPGAEIREIVRICEEAGVTQRIMPGVSALLDGQVSISKLRNVEIEDLLRRAPVQTDIAAVAGLLKGRRVLVTGGGGSIGSELCRQILQARPSQLMLLGHGENSIFEIQNELLDAVKRLDQPAPEILSFIADIRFPDRLLAVFRQTQPQIVFHAAAHKHVPLMEHNPAEAITNNVLGTRNVINAALAVGVEHFVMISTDKAVNPTSVMGASKRAAELLVHEAALRSGRAYVAVRFGNVLGSRGSVILTFKRQIAAGGPVTITDPEMKRFFMTIPEAVQLVLQAAVLGNGGEVFLLDMGEPVKIVDLAQDLIRLSGLEPYSEIGIVFTGLRPGEKLFEELFIPGEEYKRTQHEKVFIATNASSFVPTDLGNVIAALEQAARTDDATTIIRILRALIPEFKPPHPAHADAPALAQTVTNPAVLQLKPNGR